MKNIIYCLLPLCILSCVVTQNQPNEVILKETTLNKTPRDFKKIVICGSGLLGARNFLENLAGSINRGLKLKGINSTYYFVGNNRLAPGTAFINIPGSEKADAYMIFSQTDPPVPQAQHIERAGKTRGNNLDQFLTIKLYDSPSAHAPIWDALLKTDFNFTTDEVYTSISSMILRRLGANQIFR